MTSQNQCSSPIQSLAEANPHLVENPCTKLIPKIHIFHATFATKSYHTKQNWACSLELNECRQGVLSHF